ncbi:MAG: VOC family protein [Anaerolineae bacterium]
MIEIGEKISPFFTLCGNAEEAMRYYISIFPDSRMLSLTHFGKGDRGEEGKVLNGTFELMGKQFMVMDMEQQYCPESTWAVSLLVNCSQEAEFDRLFDGLSEGGSVMMGPEPVYNLRKVSWVTDKFGVTWQLVWA